MKTISLPIQIKNNLIAIISLTIAIIALLYNTWRNEHTEKNRNTRTAAFEVLKELGELQVVINYSYFQHNSMMGNPYLGWEKIAYINDLSQLLPPPIPVNIKDLSEAWGKNWEKIPTNETAVDKITHAIDQSRESILAVLRQLK